jgi:hypothetical protein
VTRERDAVVEQIAKLLALAENHAATPAEAATAAKRAQALMEKYEIQRSIVDHKREVGEDGDLENEALWSGKQRTSWIAILAEEIARLYSCRTVTVFDRAQAPVVMTLLGHEQDTQVVRYFFTSISRDIERLTQEALDWGTIHGRTGANNFRMGAVATVIERLKEARKEAEAAFVREAWLKSASAVADARQALMRTADHRLSKASAVEDMMRRTFEGLRQGRVGASNYDPEARAAGERAGRSIGIRRGLGSGEGKRELR